MASPRPYRPNAPAASLRLGSGLSSAGVLPTSVDNYAAQIGDSHESRLFALPCQSSKQRRCRGMLLPELRLMQPLRAVVLGSKPTVGTGACMGSRLCAVRRGSPTIVILHGGSVALPRVLKASPSRSNDRPLQRHDFDAFQLFASPCSTPRHTCSPPSLRCRCRAI